MDYELLTLSPSMNPLISICIPAYKRTDFLKRLLDSVSIQTCKNFEVIVTDDSPGNDVLELCNSYQDKFPLSYCRNSQPLGTPENWNEAIRKAKGEWIKLMHDDDWFSQDNSLQLFRDAIESSTNASFIFSAYRNIYLDNSKQEEIYVSSFRYKLILKNAATLFSKNIIGPPSVILHRNENHFFYDNNLKWLVDIDFYMRCLKTGKPEYIHLPLINVGLSSHQVTKETFRVREVEVPENFYLLHKVGLNQLRNIYVYDAWWRLIRNLGIRNINDVYESGYKEKIPSAIIMTIKIQKKIPLSALKIGLISKFFMFISFILCFKKFNNADF